MAETEILQKCQLEEQRYIKNSSQPVCLNYYGLDLVHTNFYDALTSIQFCKSLISKLFFEIGEHSISNIPNGVRYKRGSQFASIFTNLDSAPSFFCDLLSLKNTILGISAHIHRFELERNGTRVHTIHKCTSFKEYWALTFL